MGTGLLEYEYMKVVLIVAGCIVVGILLWTFGPRLLKTLVLIGLVSPYEQHVANAPTILVLGDSTGYGTGVKKATASVAGRMGSDFPGFNIMNDSVNGRRLGELLPVAKTLEGEYALILLQIGANDILQKGDVTKVEQELRELVTILSEHTEHLVMLSSGNVGGSSAFTGEVAKEYEALSRVYRDMFLQVSRETELTYIDLFVEPADDPFIIEAKTYMSIDGLHPSGAGYGLWYVKLQPVLKEKLLSS